MNLFKRNRRNSGPILEIATTQGRVGLFEDSLNGTRMAFSTVSGGQIGHWLDERASEGCETCIVDNTAIDENEPALREWLEANPDPERKPRVVLMTSNRMPGDAYVESLANLNVQCIFTQDMAEADVPAVLAEALLNPSASLVGDSTQGVEPETGSFMPVKKHKAPATPAAEPVKMPEPVPEPEPVWAPASSGPSALAAPKATRESQPTAAPGISKTTWEPQTWVAPTTTPQETPASAAVTGPLPTIAPQVTDKSQAKKVQVELEPEKHEDAADNEVGPRDINRLILERRAAEHAATQTNQDAPVSEFAPVRVAKHTAKTADENVEQESIEQKKAKLQTGPFRLNIEDVIKPTASVATASVTAAMGTNDGDKAAATIPSEDEAAKKAERKAAREAAREERRRETARLLALPVRCIETGKIYENAEAAKAAIGKDILSALKCKGQRAGGFTWEVIEESVAPKTNNTEGMPEEKNEEATGCAIDVRRSMGLIDNKKVKPVRVDVASLHRSAGCSTLALAIALELCALGKRPLLELATQAEVDSLGWALSGSETIYDGILYDGCLVAAPDSETAKRAHYDAVVRDLGCIVNKDGKVPEPDKADASVLLFGTSPWDIKACVDAFGKSAGTIAKRTLASRSECEHNLSEIARAFAEVANVKTPTIAHVPNLDYILISDERYPEALAPLIGDLAKKQV